MVTRRSQCRYSTNSCVESCQATIGGGETRRFASAASAVTAGMDFRIADTFTDSLARLTGDEQKAAKTTAFDLQLNPVNPGRQLHKIEKSKDKNFWSVRVR